MIIIIIIIIIITIIAGDNRSLQSQSLGCY